MNGRDLRRTLEARSLIQRIYDDLRFPPPIPCGDLRMLASTAVWVVGIENRPKGERWARVFEILQLNENRWRALIRQDVPRHDPRHPAAVAVGADLPPNRGGLLPCYIPWKGWPDEYARAVRETGGGEWQPPKLGVCANDWPVLSQVAEKAPPVLQALPGLANGEDDLGEPPALKLIRHTP